MEAFDAVYFRGPYDDVRVPARQPSRRQVEVEADDSDARPSHRWRLREISAVLGRGARSGGKQRERGNERKRQPGRAYMPPLWKRRGSLLPGCTVDRACPPWTIAP